MIFEFFKEIKQFKKHQGYIVIDSSRKKLKELKSSYQFFEFQFFSLEWVDNNPTGQENNIHC